MKIRLTIAMLLALAGLGSPASSAPDPIMSTIGAPDVELHFSALPERLSIHEMDPSTFQVAEPVAPAPPRKWRGLSEELCLAVAIYHEARGESLEGQQAVASVILQRVATPDRWGDRVCEVVRPVAFSFLDEDRSFAPIHEIEAWEGVWRVAHDILKTGPLERFAGADHYHTESVNPTWNRKMDLIAEIGAHRFWRDPASGFHGS